MSAPIISRRRSRRSTNTPAIGPNRKAGKVRASITPEIAIAAFTPPILVTSVVTATNPTQSPREDTVIAARSRANGPVRSRSPRVADRVPRSAATSSEMEDTRCSYDSVVAGSATGVSGAGSFVAVAVVVAFFAVVVVALVFFAVVVVAPVFFAAVFFREVVFLAGERLAFAAARAARASRFAWR